MPHKRKAKSAHQTKLLFEPDDSHLYLQYYSQTSDSVTVPLHTLIPVFVINYIQSHNIKVYLYKTKETESNPFTVELKKSSYTFSFCSELPDHVSKCRLPCWYLPSQQTCLAGLCSVVRYIVKLTAFSDQTQAVKKCEELLGHQYGCLSAPAEVSTWTKFCELDLPAATRAFFNSEKQNFPIQLSKFEAHLDQPIRIHNVRKRMQDEEGKENSNPQTNGKVDPILSYAKSNHIFAEGPDLLISDLMLYPCVAIMVQVQEKAMRKRFPLIMRWFDHLTATTAVASTIQLLLDKIEDERNLEDIGVIEVPKESLYKCDPSRDSNKICTSQALVEKNIDWWQESSLKSLQTFTESNDNWKRLNWDQLPKLVHPQAGDLPASRLVRKCEQLQGLALPIVDLAAKRKNPVIVDFCSGGGHLGLLLAYLIPQSTVHMVENKEESLARARERGVQLGLTNVWYFQSNIDYYQGHFDIGTSLHACGVATDLVIKKSADLSADCVTCPCCYGAVQQVTGVQYPRSDAFARRGCSVDDYMVMGHTADQTERHSVKCEQGELFMDIVDTDRCLQLRELGYTTLLSKIQPLTCSPKHNLIVASSPKNNSIVKENM